MYPWPTGEFDTDQTVTFKEVESTAATAIVGAWKVGVRHRIKLADVAIKAVERREKLLQQTKCGGAM